MHDQYAHLSDQDLIMAADGELPAERGPGVLEHLDACWSCRERLHTIESTIQEYVRARNHSLHPHLPPVDGARALLLARLAESSRNVPLNWTWSRGIRLMATGVPVFLCVLLAVVILFQSTVSADGPEPRAKLTPGETRPVTLDEVCSQTKAEVVSRDISEETQRRVFSEYGISGHPDNFEVDYLITPDLGGARSIRNLWPQPYSARWNSHVKDKLEQRLHELVCQGKVDLPTAQHDIASDWIGAYKKYFRTNKPPAE